MQATTFSYDSVGNLVAAINPVIGVFNQYDLANRLISSTSSTEEAVAGTVTQINADTTIGENNFESDGRTLQVNGRTITVNGSHTFANLILANGARLTHSPTTATKVGRLDITVSGTLTVDATSRIDVTGRGFLGGRQPGNPFFNDGTTVGFQRGSTGIAGGSYGGLGGAFLASPNPVYGDFRNPNDIGSGGSTDGTPAGNGGGLIRIVAQTIQLDGLIKADGGNGNCCSASGGSGGGIRVDVGTLRGTGQLSANGGSGQNSNGSGGGGGRVAVYYQDAVGFDFSKVIAPGGTSP